MMIRKETGFCYLQSRYYDPALCRFLNADGLASTGQGILGCNMFAYCGNEPIRCADPKGKDAILLLKEDGLGHLGVMIQDADGNWHHFYWGAAGWKKDCYSAHFSPTTAKVYYEDYSGELTLDAINSNSSYHDYTQMLYLSGDFSESAEEYERHLEGTYHVLTNNCSQVTTRILAKSNTEYTDIISTASHYLLPSQAFNYIKKKIRIRDTIRTAAAKSGLLDVA